MVAHLEMLQSRGTLQDVKASIIARCTRGLFGRNIFRAKKKEKERYTTAQVMIAAPWRGGVVRMAKNRRELAAEQQLAEVDAKEGGKQREEGLGEGEQKEQGLGEGGKQGEETSPTG